MEPAFGPIRRRTMTVENGRHVPRRAIAGWVLFDWAAQPFFTLIITFVYAPYFASAIAANPVEGQALWGYATAGAALVVALFSPILGAVADASGRRKPWIVGFGVLVVIGASLLWFGRPGDASVIPLVLTAYAIGVIGVEFAGVFTNAMMPSLVSPGRVGRLSGTGWAIGYVGGLLSLVLVLGFLAGNPHTGKTLLGITPLFGLDPALREGDRAVGPLAAVWFVVFVLPLFFFTPDVRGGLPLRAAAREGIATLKQTLRALPRNRAVATFLIANMIYTDGMLALFAFGGIYAAGTFGWGTIQIGVFGILLNITAMIGAYLGGKLDDRFGSKRVILGSLAILVVCCDRVSVDRARPRVVCHPGRSAGARRANVFVARRKTLHRDRAGDRPRGRAHAGRFTHAGGAPCAARPHHAVLRLARVVRQGHVVHGAAARRRGDGRVREPEGRPGGAGGIFCGRSSDIKSRASLTKVVIPAEREAREPGPMKH